MQDTVIDRLQRTGEVLTQHGTNMVLSLALLIAGLVLVRWIHNGLRRLMPKTPFGTVFCNIVYIVMVMIVITAAAVEFGAKPVNVFRLLSIVALAAIGLMIFMRPFIPSMPFKVGHTVKIGDLLGKIEAMTFLNTRLKTFDGKTFFVPNTKIINDIVVRDTKNSYKI